MAPPSLSAEQLAFYGTYGYLLLPQWIPPPLLTALQDETEAVTYPTPPHPSHGHRPCPLLLWRLAEGGEGARAHARALPLPLVLGTPGRARCLRRRLPSCCCPPDRPGAVCVCGRSVQGLRGQFGETAVESQWMWSRASATPAALTPTLAQAQELPCAAPATQTPAAAAPYPPHPRLLAWLWLCSVWTRTVALCAWLLPRSRCRRHRRAPTPLPIPTTPAHAPQPHASATKNSAAGRTFLTPARQLLGEEIGIGVDMNRYTGDVGWHPDGRGPGDDWGLGAHPPPRSITSANPRQLQTDPPKFPGLPNKTLLSCLLDLWAEKQIFLRCCACASQTRRSSWSTWTR
eukprot:COSAG04_NODE_216_length_19953_cov_85.343558_4_plen_345_part_00